MGEENIRRIMVLGSVPSLGPVVLYDDMEGVFKWAITGNAGDFAGTKDAAVMYNDDASMKLTTRVTGPQIGDWVQALRTLYQRPGKRYAIECLWRPASLTIVDKVTFQFDILDGGNGHHGGIMCYLAAARWFYKRADGAYVELAGAPRQPAALAWHRLRLEFNELTGKYIKLIADGQEVDMSALPFQSEVNVSPVKFELLVKVESATANAALVHVDDVLVMEI